MGNSLDPLELLSSSLFIMLPLLIILVGTIAFRSQLIRLLEKQTVKVNLGILASMQLSMSLVIGGVSEFYMNNIGSEIIEIAELDIPLSNLLSELEVAQMHQVIWFERAILFSYKGNKSKKDDAINQSHSYAKSIKKHLSAINKLLSKSASFAYSERSLNKISEFQKKIRDYGANYESFSSLKSEFFNHIDAGNLPSDEDLFRFEQLEDQLVHQIETILFQVEEFTLNSARRAEKDEKMAEFKIIMILILAFLSSLSMIMIVARVLRSSLRKSTDNLVKITQYMSEQTQDLSEASSEATKVSTESKRSLSETVSSINEITRVNENSFDQLKMLQASRENIERFTKIAEDRISNLMDSIRTVEKASANLQEITKIITDIDKETDAINTIVFKTQLLSVNASIEASRAGEAGKGFSVVAQEVGNLAALSGESASAIDELINQSNDKIVGLLQQNSTSINTGVKAADSVAEVFREINKDLIQMTSQNEKVFELAQIQNNEMQRINSTVKDLQGSSRLSNDVAMTTNQIVGNLVKSQFDLQSTTGEIESLIDEEVVQKAQ